MGPHTEISIEEGSTNVYADLGHADADEAPLRSLLSMLISINPGHRFRPISWIMMYPRSSPSTWSWW